MNATARAALLLTSLIGAALLSTGCVYRPNVQQGNLLEVEDIDKVETGMTRSQVRYLLGTPMVADSFNPQRWDYLYTFRRGRESKIDRSHFVVHFEGDRVSRVEKLDLPDRASGRPREEPLIEPAGERGMPPAEREPPPPPQTPAEDDAD